MKTYIYGIFLLTLTSCQTFLEQDENLPPINPNYYIMDWVVYTTDEKHTPPITDLKEGEYRLKGYGRTYYDWTRRSMLESWDTFCVPIFENPDTEFKFPCKFLNTGEVSYLLVDTKAVPSRHECCIFSENFHPPTPSYARDAHMIYNSTITIDGEEADVFSLNIPMPGPFWYGWYKNKIVDGHRVPASFAFPTVPPEIYTSHLFHNFRLVKPDPIIFKVPESCRKAEKCIVFK